MSGPVPGRTGRYAAALRYEVGVSGGRAFVMDEDTELGELIPESQIGAARQGSLAQVLDIAPGRWDARTEADRARRGYGLLVLRGLLVRRVGYAGRFGAELLSAGDLLRPWEFDGDDMIGFETTWRVLTSTRLAVLDLRWAERMAPFPRIGPALAGRALYRSRRVTAMMAIAQQPKRHLPVSAGDEDIHVGAGTRPHRPVCRGIAL